MKSGYVSVLLEPTEPGLRAVRVPGKAEAERLKQERATDGAVFMGRAVYWMALSDTVTWGGLDPASWSGIS